jgi:hypothetical protein
MNLTAGPDEARARAEANFKKEERAKDGAKAIAAYLANSRRLVREKDRKAEGATAGQRGGREKG